MKISKTIFATLLLSLTLLFGSCVKEPMGADVNLSTEKVEMSLSVTSKALGSGQLYLQGEQVYKSVYVFIFDQTTNKLENADNLQMASVGASKIWRVSQGKKLVYCVVNPETTLVNGFNGLTNSSTPTNLSSMITAYRSVDAVATQQDGLLLTGYAEVEAAVGTVAKVNIEVGYRTGRISLLMRLGEGFGKTVKIDKVEFLDKDGASTISTESTLFGENTAMTSGAPTAPTLPKNITKIQPTIDDDIYDRVWDFYSFPKTLDGGKLKITATVGIEPKTYEIPLKKDGADVSIEPNTVINVLATIYPELETTIEVVKWNKISTSADMGKYVRFDNSSVSIGGVPVGMTLTDLELDPSFVIPENPIETYGGDNLSFQITCESNIGKWYVTVTGDDNNSDLSERIYTEVVKTNAIGYTAPNTTTAATHTVDIVFDRIEPYAPYTHLTFSIYQDDIYPESERKPVKQWRLPRYAGFIPAWNTNSHWGATEDFIYGVFISKAGSVLQEGNASTDSPVNFTNANTACNNLGLGWYVPSFANQMIYIYTLDDLSTKPFGSSYEGFIGGVKYWTAEPAGVQVLVVQRPSSITSQSITALSTARYRCIRNDRPSSAPVIETYRIVDGKKVPYPALP